MDAIDFLVLDQNNADILSAVRDDVFDNPIIPEQAKAFLAADQHNMVVALDAGQVIGMASAVTMLHPDKKPEVFVQEVGVHDNYLRRGIGKKLTQLLLSLVRGAHDHDVWLATEDDNVAARALYRSLGARETKGIVVYDWGHAMDDD